MKNVREKGTGSIYKAGNGYRVQVTAGYGPDGRQLYARVRCKTHAEAVQTLNRVVQELATGKVGAPTGTRLADYLEAWLKDVVEPGLAPNTAKLYRWIVKDHIVPTLGRKLVDRVTRKEVQRLIRLKSEQVVQPRSKDGKPTSTKTLSQSTLRNIRAVLHSAYAEAVRDGLAPSNPADHVALPRAPQAETQFLNPAEAALLLKAAEPTEFGPLVSFLLATGCRIGEATGLRWQDVDLDRGYAHVRGQLQRQGGRLVYVPGTKTNKGRVLPLAPRVVTMLQGMRLLGAEPDPDGVIFLNVYGRRFDRKYVGTGIKALCRQAGIPEVSPHKLRHTYATTALAGTGDLHGVQKMLGHSQVSLTANLYGHATAESLRPVSDTVERVMRDAMKEDQT